MMENYYEILGVSQSATPQELKRVFQRLALQHHPDKTPTFNHASRFVAISEAWKVLGDPELRRQYDAAWVQRCTAQALPIQDSVCIEGFELAEDGRRVFPCRCGGVYELTLQDVEFQVDYLSCTSCSLCVEVLYSKESM